MNVPGVEHVIVVVPARDEAATVADCIASVDRAAALAPAGQVDVIVAADCCRDATASIAAAVTVTAANVAVLSGRWGSVGRARAAGTAFGLARTTVPADRIWIASTDADSVVPPGWLAHQLEQAAGGADMVLGIVGLPDDTLAELAERFRCHYRWSGVDHPHVHGANLGLRASAYQQIGGWRHLTLGEEHDLVSRAGAARITVCRTDQHPVITSARIHSRVRRGFAGDLARLSAG